MKSQTKVYVSLVCFGLCVLQGCRLQRKAPAFPKHRVVRGQSLRVASLVEIVSSLPDFPQNPSPRRGPDYTGATVTLLRDAFQKMYGLDLQVVKSPDKSAGTRVFIGREAVLSSGMVSEKALLAVAPDGFVVTCNERGVAIAGAEPAFTCYGVYGFLEELGVRFYEMRKTHYPEDPPAEIRPLVLLDKPVFSYRNGGTFAQRKSSSLLGDPRRGMNPELFTRQAGSDLWIDHTAGYLVPIKLYHDKFPQYYSLSEGERLGKDKLSDHRCALCLSNPDVCRISQGRALGWIALEPEKKFFNITYGDCGRWCECPQCVKLDPAPKEYANRLLSWVNPIARAVAAKYPDKVIMTFAYGGSDKAPEHRGPEDNVWIIGSTGCGNLVFWDHAIQRELPAAARNLAKINGWLQRYPNQYLVCEYLSGQYEPALIDNLTARLRYYADRGLRGIFASYGHPVNFEPVWRYLYPKLLWNPYQDPYELADAFIDYYYGSAASDIKGIFRLYHERYRVTLKGKHPIKGVYPERYYRADLVNAVTDCFRKAEQVTEGEPKLRQEICDEEILFIRDCITHPFSNEAGPEAKELLLSQLKRIYELADLATDKARIAFARKTYQLGLHAESVQKGALEVVDEWLRQKKFPQPKPVITEKGVEFPLNCFMKAFGPQKWDGVNWPCPPRTAIFVYIKGNSANRSDRAEVEFDLEKVPGEGRAALEFWGQDCDHPVPAAGISIQLNGRGIYRGPVSFVKHNWSAQRFPIPAGLLKKGHNLLEIINVGDPKSIKKWYQRWAAICSARIEFE